MEDNQLKAIQTQIERDERKQNDLNTLKESLKPRKKLFSQVRMNLVALQLLIVFLAKVKPSQPRLPKLTTLLPNKKLVLAEQMLQ